VRRNSPNAGTVSTVLPYAWVLLTLAIGSASDKLRRPSPTASDHVQGLHSPQEIAGYVHDPNIEIRRSAYLTLGNLANRLAEPDKGAALRLLLDGLHDSDRSVQTQVAFSLGMFGPDAEAAIGPLLKLAPSNPMVVGPLGRIGKDHPSLVVPALLELGSHPNSDSLTALASAVEAVRALKFFPNQAAEIVRGLSGSASLAADTTGRGSFILKNYLNAWLDTITTLDPRAAFYDPSVLEAPIVTLLRGKQGNIVPKYWVLGIVGRLQQPTAAELDAVRLVARTGDTAKIRKQAEAILDARAENGH